MTLKEIVPTPVFSALGAELISLKPRPAEYPVERSRLDAACRELEATSVVLYTESGVEVIHQMCGIRLVPV